MPGYPKRKRFEKIELIFMGPSENKEKAINMLETIGFIDTTESIPWRYAFPDCNEDSETGQVLAGIRYRENLTQKELSKLAGIPQSHISEMERGKRTIDLKTAKKLASILNIGYKVFL